MPSLHLVVDGYNVSKTGYPELPLADQRSRLVGQLARPRRAHGGGDHRRVRRCRGGHRAAPRLPGRAGAFSDPGVLADDVIRDLVAAEPQGRPVVVATSDRAVVESVRRSGAHAVPSAVLLERLVRLYGAAVSGRRRNCRWVAPNVVGIGATSRPTSREQR